MYTFSSRLKIVAITLMVVGALGVGFGFMDANKSLDDVKTLLAEEASGHHGGGHGEATHGEASHSEDTHKEEVHAEETHTEGESHDETSHSEESNTEEVAHVAEASSHDTSNEHHAEADAHHGDAHDAEHVMHQIHNRPWSAFYIAAFFFMMISLGVLAFYAIQYASQAGWSPLLLRIMEGITAYLLPGALIVLAIAAASHYIGHDSIFVWMNPDMVNPESADYDKLVAGKKGWLNVPWFIIRGLIFIAGWSLYRYFSRKFSIAQDQATDNKNFKKTFRISAAFLVFFIYTESMMSWDWIMSVDPHWFSTLFGWYVFAGMMVCGVTVIAMITMYLKGKGLLPQVNDSHLHDLAKFMFGFSIFWTYLWFSQFMLIWYSNIPEEVTYFVTRIEDYKLPFFGMLAMNFIFPLLLLMNSDYKRIPWFVVMAGLVILGGHYIDVFNMIMPATVGDRWSIGIPEIGSMLFFAGLFIFIVFTALTKAPLTPTRNPFVKESEHFHY